MATESKKNDKWLVAISVAFGALMATIDSSIVNVAMPNIRGSVGATIEEVAWVSTAYIIAMVLVMPLTGLLGAIIGQKRLYIGSLILFVVGSMLCGTARTLPLLVVYRILQGFGAGSLQPSQQAILRQVFPAKEQGTAMGFFSMIVMIGPAVGPTLGGWITDNFSWPWIFYINLPIGIIGILMTLRNLHEAEDIKEANRLRAKELETHMDWAGIIFMAIGIGTLQYFLEEGPSKDWFESTPILVTGAVAAVSLSIFIIRELTYSHPVINLKLFKDRTFSSASFIGGIVYAVLMGSMFMLPVFMQELLGFDATLSGMTLMPRTLAMIAVTPLVSKLYNLVQPAYIVGFGVLLFVLGSYELSHITALSSAKDIIFPLLITGSGLSCLFVPLTTAALSSVPRKDLSDAAGISSFVRQIGGSVGITIFTTLLTRYGQIATQTVSWHMNPLRPEFAMEMQKYMHRFSSLGHDKAMSIVTQMMHGRAMLQGTVLGFEKTFLLQGLAFLSVLPLLYFLRVDRSESPSEHIEVHME